MVLSVLNSEDRGLLQSIKNALPPDMEVYLVGGAVRDLILKRPIHDFDFILKSGSRRAGKRVADALGGAFLMLDAEREISRVILKGEDTARVILDFSVFRAATLEEDLRARDFSINAMALSLINPENLIDPLGGLEDLRNRLLKACSSESFAQDSLRCVRAVRMAVEFNLRMTGETGNALRAAAHLLPQVSPERLRDELFKILDGSRVSTALELLDRFGILAIILPHLEAIKNVEQSLPHEMDVWRHTLGLVDGLEKLYDVLASEFSEEKSDNLTMGLAVLKLGSFRAKLAEHFSRRLNPDRSRRALLMLAGLYHDVGKGSTLSIDSAGKRHFYTHEIIGDEIVEAAAGSLAISNIETLHLRKLVRNHMRIHMLSIAGDSATRRAIYRFFRDTGEAGIEICLLSLADILSRRSGAPEFERWNRELSITEQMLDSYWNHSEDRISPPKLVDGELLMAHFNLTPGRQIGDVLEAVREAQACGKISDRGQALEFARRWLEDNRPAEEMRRNSI